MEYLILTGEVLHAIFVPKDKNDRTNSTNFEVKDYRPKTKKKHMMKAIPFSSTGTSSPGQIRCSYILFLLMIPGTHC